MAGVVDGLAPVVAAVDESGGAVGGCCNFLVIGPGTGPASS